MAKLLKGSRALLDEANRVVRALSPQDLAGMLERKEAVLVDVREGRELEEHGRIPGSVHAPRGQLEFLADPECPMHKPELATDKLLVAHCAGGGRSALAAKTLLDMGFPRVAHLAGGFKAWQEAGKPVQRRPQPKAKPARARRKQPGGRSGRSG